MDKSGDCTAELTSVGVMVYRQVSVPASRVPSTPGKCLPMYSPAGW
jgi:hypothetical protein